MAGGGMGAPTSTAQMGGSGFMGGLSAAPQQTAPAAAPAPSAAPVASDNLQFGTAGVGTGAIETPQVSPMTQQMQAPAPMQNPYASPMPQQMYRPQMMQQQYGGLQSLLMNLINRYQQPQQRYAPMPQYQNRALAYRPNLQQAQANLNRTATTKAEAQAAAEAAALAKLGLGEEGVIDPGFRNWQYRQYLNAMNSSGG